MCAPAYSWCSARAWGWWRRFSVGGLLWLLSGPRKDLVGSELTFVVTWQHLGSPSSEAWPPDSPQPRVRRPDQAQNRTWLLLWLLSVLRSGFAANNEPFMGTRTRETRQAPRAAGLAPVQIFLGMWNYLNQREINLLQMLIQMTVGRPGATREAGNSWCPRSYFLAGSSTRLPWERWRQNRSPVLGGGSYGVIFHRPRL